jgi:hypothetical protein
VIAATVAAALRDAGRPLRANEFARVDFVAPDPERLVERDPSLRIREHEAVRATCILSRRTACAKQHTEALARLRQAQ